MGPSRDFAVTQLGTNDRCSPSIPELDPMLIGLRILESGLLAPTSPTVRFHLPDRIFKEIRLVAAVRTETKMASHVLP